MRFLLYLAVIGVAVYLLIALIQARGRRSRGASPRRGPGPTPGARPGRPVAPDDDPAFLAELDRQRRAAERKAAGGAGKPKGPGSQSAQPPEKPRTKGKPDGGPLDDAGKRGGQAPGTEPRSTEPRSTEPQNPTSPDPEPDLRAEDGGSGGERPDPR